ncbi:MAG: PhoX family phosphatase [Hyphomicrobiaceae bacterium]|nr:PhoX family phosphatase [Hyphomicrobiaceae bacterium]
MQRPFKPSAVLAEEGEDEATNLTANPTIGDIISERLSRRILLSGALATAAMAVTASPRELIAAESSNPATPNFNFPELAAGADERHHVAEGYDADILIRWGDKVLKDAPDFTPGVPDPEAQQRQFGYNNDFLGYLPLDGSSEHGLLVANHEYTDPELMFTGVEVGAGKQANWDQISRQQVDAEMMAHGGSVIEVKREGGKWTVLPDSKYARRITAETDMRISGPAAGRPKLKTSADPSGTRVKGMLNNCAGAMTPWGTWLTCEENFNNYFWGKGEINKATDAAALKRYGIPSENYFWAKFHERFDIIKEPNEANRFGWVVEIDPMDPESTPVKRTALGRFKHEGAGNIVNRDGRFVVYQGDDQRFDYVYRFVTKNTVDLANPKANKDILDEGTLYVARFDADGSGAWLPLEHGTAPLDAANGFNDQGDVVVHARMAADLLGATKMDRPEDIEANPKTGKVYVMLTNNTKRTVAETDAANPRAKNAFGHILEITPDSGDHAAPTFRWEILVRCGDPAKGDVGATFNPRTTKDGWFGTPDNCVVDSLGRLWIATDGNSLDKTGRTDGIWAMETSGETRATSKLFFRVPVGAEMCGPMFTPDAETLFVAVQHPGEGDSDSPSTFENPTTRWPDFKPDMPPRPSIVAITRRGGGKIGV